MIEVKKNNFFLNEEVNTFLKNIIKNKSLANGYIFYGAEGLGKKQTALQFIKEIFKQSSPSENVDERITNNNHPDFLIIEPNSLLSTKSLGSSDLEKTVKSGSEIIKIAQIRNIKTFLSQKKVESMSHQELKQYVLEIISHQINDTIGKEEEMEAWREMSDFFGEQFEIIILEIQAKYVNDKNVIETEIDSQKQRIELLEKNNFDQEKKDMWDD